MEIVERIIRTVAYFDLFDYPLTRAETRRWLYGAGAVSFGEVDDAVAALVKSGALKEVNGLLSAPDHDGLAAVRESRFRHSCRKWKRARRWARFFSALPGIELVGIGNTLAYHNAKDGSDIDFFIVTAPGTIWRSRILCALAAAVFNLRPRVNDNRDKLCLSFFVTSDALELSRMSLIDRHCEERAHERRGNPMGDASMFDIYMHYWLRQMTPLAGSAKTAALWRELNHGAEERGVLAAPGFWKKIFYPLQWLPGDFLKERQRRHFPEVLRTALARADGGVIVSDQVLKFHVNDRRKEVYDRWVLRSEYLMKQISNT